MRRCQFMRPGPKIKCGMSESVRHIAHIFFVRVCVASFALVLAWLLLSPLRVLLLLLLSILVFLWLCFCHFVKTIDLLSYILYHFIYSISIEFYTCGPRSHTYPPALDFCNFISNFEFVLRELKFYLRETFDITFGYLFQRTW